MFNRRKRHPSPQKQQVIEYFRKHVSPGKVAFFEKYGMPFVMGHREGAYLEDLDGKQKLYNLHCNGGVFNLGHRHPELIDVLTSALTTYDIGNHHLISQPRAELAALIARLMPGSLTYTIFGVSGGEAIDTALKIARGFTGRRKIISARGGYHGHTGLAILAGEDRYRKPFLLEDPEFIQVPFNNIPALRAALHQDVAAVLLETIPATAGMLVPEETYLQEVKTLCQEAGALLILDEVQAGLGRTGKLWAFEHFGVIPDIVVLGKGLSGGLYPISATVIDERLERVFHPDPFIHVSTFGGAELGCIVAKRVLEITATPSFLQHVNEVAQALQKALQPLIRKHRLLKEVQGIGLMLALVLQDKLAGPVLTKTAYEQGLLLVYANHNPSRVQLLPPLTMPLEDIPDIVNRLDTALRQAQRLLPLLKTREKIRTFFHG